MFLKGLLAETKFILHCLSSSGRDTNDRQGLKGCLPRRTTKIGLFNRIGHAFFQKFSLLLNGKFW